MNGDLLSMVVSAAANLQTAFWTLLWVIGGLMGFLYGGQTVLAWVKDTQQPGPPQVSTGAKISIFFIGVLLVNLPFFINTTSESIGLTARGYSPISYASPDRYGLLAQGIDAVLTLATMFGGWFALKGLFLLKSASEQTGRGQYAGDSVSKGLGHIIGGACLVQIPAVLEAAAETVNLTW
ncbi:conjugal transfer protein TraQ [Halomonas elongata]|uniref:conjugal transfer protein TraQ n=1 Tax=Halomonas elongata TaxID=2746 RepID=UPI00255AB19F|nr:conjugal transfer protein TraQ [Halomonas elongata]MDL4860704.1 conjugal transfer protein TraQ [Halomonas elongata]